MMISDNDLNTLINCLQTTFTSVDQEIREEAEKVLSSYQSNMLLYTKLLLESVLPQRDFDIKIKIAVLLQLKRAIIEYLDNCDSYNIEQIIEIIKIYLEILIKPGIEDKLLQNISESFIILLSALEQTPSNLFELSSSLCQSLLNTSIPLESYKGIMIILSSIIKCDSFTRDNDVQIVTEIIPLAKRMLEGIHLNLQQVTIDTNKDKYLSYIKLIGELYALLFNCRAKKEPKKESNKRLKQFISSAFIQFIPFGLKMLFEVIPIYVPHPPLCWTQDKQIDTSLNNMKYHIMRFICLMIKGLPQSILEPEVLKMHIEIMKMISINLDFILLTKYNEIRVLTSENNCKYTQLMAQMILYLSNAFSKRTFKKEFEPFCGNFFKNIILPFLVITQSEMDQSIKDPHSYSVLVNDVIYKNTIKSIKSSMSLLLKNFVHEQNEHFISFYVIELLGTVLTNTNDANKEHANSLLTPNDYIVKMNPSNEERLDLCLLIFGILRYHFTDKSIEHNFCTKIKDHLSILFSDNAQSYIKHKLCIILNQYFKVFEAIDLENSNNSSIALSFIRYLYQNIIAESDMLVATESTETLKRIIRFIQKDKVTLQIIINLLIEIMKILPKTFSHHIFEILYQIKLSVSNTIYDTELFKLILDRIAIEAAQQHRIKYKQSSSNDNSTIALNESEKKVNRSILMTNCFNTAKLMMKNPSFVLSNSQTIEESLSPLIYYIKSPDKIVFDTDIITMITKLITATKALPKIALTLLPDLCKYAQKNKGITIDLFELINLYFIYGGGIIEQNDTYLKGISDIIKQSSIDQKKNTSSGYISLLIHVWLMNSNAVPSELVVKFVSEAIKALSRGYIILTKNPKHSLGSQNNFILNLLVLYSSFIHYPSICIELLNKNNQMYDFIEWSKILNDLIVYSYAVKMIILSLCLLINSDCFKKDDFTFVNLAFSYLQLVQTTEKCKLKKKTKIRIEYITDENKENEDDEEKDIDIDGSNHESQSDGDSDSDETITDDEEEEDEDEDDFGNEVWFESKEKMDNILSRTLNSHKSIDEYKEFKASLEIFKNNSPQQFEIWTASLSDCDRTRLTAILQTVRIEVNDRNSIISIPRKIIKVKRNNNP